MTKRLFRGKRVDNGEWVKGFYSFEGYANKHYISAWYYGSYAELQQFEVDPETVGQYVRKDFDGTDLFEGDIVSYNGGFFYLRYYEPHFAYYFSGLNGRGDANGFTLVSHKFIKVGNIYDNPEFLERRPENA